MNDLKRCACREHKGSNPLPLTEFYPDSGKQDGLSPWCKDCARRAARLWRKANRVRDRENSRRWYAEHPEKLRDKYLAEVRRSIRDNAASRDTASHYGEPWTIRQLETAVRADLTARQAAEILGRTIRAVTAVRRELRGKPGPAETVHTGTMEDTWT